MIVFDKNKTLALRPELFLAKNTPAPFAQLRGLAHDCLCGGTCPECQQMTGYGHMVDTTQESWQMSGYGHLIDSYQESTQLYGYEDNGSMGFVDTAIPSEPSPSITIPDWLDGGSLSVPSGGCGWIRAGAQEADVITPKQNALMDAAGLITNQILIGQSPTIEQIISAYQSLRQKVVDFIAYVSNTALFCDGRASQQALNTVMPYMDGSCGYAWPPPMVPSQQNCISWGDGTIAGPGTDGVIGALKRIMRQQGYAAPADTPIYQGQPTGGGVTPLYPSGGGLLTMGLGSNLVPLAIGAAALYFFMKRRG